ncbi:PREDICTED: uncharacterized protein LOC108360564 [Rhagoletis zephyria]|uniref:uncharacterized protein LOC108360564 n=1 Tax=Rhagoletis zephyria TaxID=28612 RepID=UPI0008119FE7|nr:PREDICTED: uncharacterized protein LOC108360564 [Rhagoletis zephyria]XP_036318438.1 uncharacterized protein LOC118733224 [Rhagoletis pomonella]
MPNQFPIKPPAQIPCAHWNHFPMHPRVMIAFSSIIKGSDSPLPPPPSPGSYSYCSACNAMQKLCIKPQRSAHAQT